MGPTIRDGHLPNPPLPHTTHNSSNPRAPALRVENERLTVLGLKLKDLRPLSFRVSVRGWSERGSRWTRLARAYWHGLKKRVIDPHCGEVAVLIQRR